MQASPLLLGNLIMRKMNKKVFRPFLRWAPLALMKVLILLGVLGWVILLFSPTLFLLLDSSGAGFTEVGTKIDFSDFTVRILISQLIAMMTLFGIGLLNQGKLFFVKLKFFADKNDSTFFEDFGIMSLVMYAGLFGLLGFAFLLMMREVPKLKNLSFFIIRLCKKIPQKIRKIEERLLVEEPEIVANFEKIKLQKNTAKTKNIKTKKRL